MKNLIQGTIVRVSNKLDNGQSMIDVKLSDGSVREYMSESRRIPLANGLFSFYEGCGHSNGVKVAYCNIEPNLSAMGIISSYEISEYLNK